MRFRTACTVFSAIAVLISVTVAGNASNNMGSNSDKAVVEISYAVAGNSGALIRWDVKNGSNVIGYNVYRESEKGFVRVNPAIVPGSYISTATPGDYTFSFYDKSGTIGSSYRIGIIEIGSKEQFTNTAFAIYDAGLRSPDLGYAASAGVSVDPGLRVKNAPVKHYMSSNSEGLIEDLGTQQWVAGQPGVKIIVSDDGM